VIRVLSVQVPVVQDSVLVEIEQIDALREDVVVPEAPSAQIACSLFPTATGSS